MKGGILKGSAPTTTAPQDRPRQRNLRPNQSPGRRTRDRSVSPRVPSATTCSTSTESKSPSSRTKTAHGSTSAPRPTTQSRPTNDRPRRSLQIVHQDDSRAVLGVSPAPSITGAEEHLRLRPIGISRRRRAAFRTASRRISGEVVSATQAAFLIDVLPSDRVPGQQCGETCYQQRRRGHNDQVACHNENREHAKAIQNTVPECVNTPARDPKE